jgi:GTPase
MASIFTYDPDPPRVSSPWLTSEDAVSPSPPGSKGRSRLGPGHSSVETPPPELLADYNVTKLEPEPQATSTEYKLHLLLRPRRMYSSSSTGTHIAGSQQSKQTSSNSHSPQALAFIPAPSSQSRQNRLHQLTTQLLWRLQQSSPYHASSTGDLILPQLPESNSGLGTPSRPGKLLPGLAESRGALYEIGVSDDGTFVGLTEDEMEESLANLRSMAASLGCNVEVTRLVLVGDCEWQQSASDPTANEVKVDNRNGHVKHLDDQSNATVRHQAKLWVAEALVTSHLGGESGSANPAVAEDTLSMPKAGSSDHLRTQDIVPLVQSEAEQLRVTLTGPTTSGKSSLLGTLSTATLDNGRGKSRLSLLKHRHELVSGLTSSVAQEVIGYKASSDPLNAANVINYAAGNVTSWTDIHASSQGGRLVFVSDSAGHPRYRRTTVRGLVGWAPHWTLLCIAADDGENAPSGAGGTSSAREILGVAGAGVDLAQAHLDLCLKLEQPLAIVITKLDLASKLSLRQTLSKILSAVKGSGRVPSILPPDQTKSILGSDLEAIPESDESRAKKIAEMVRSSDHKQIVPIIMTSAAKGTGIRMLHAILHTLPMPPSPTSYDYVGAALNPEQPSCLFHIEDVFGMPAAYSTANTTTDSGVVVGGYLRFGNLTIGDNIVVGPFPADMSEGFDNNETRTPPVRSGTRSSPRFTVESSEFGSFTRSNPSTSELSRLASRNALSASVTTGEWCNAHVVSIRNLRLPVRKLEAGQAGTIGIVFDLPEEEISNGPFERGPSKAPRIRKGMVLAIPSQHMVQTGHTLQAASGFTASFEDGDVNSITQGSLVVIYIASIRASARVIRLTPQIPQNEAMQPELAELEDVFSLDYPSGKGAESDSPIFGAYGVTDVTLELLNNREWIELGSQVLIMPGGGHGLYSGTERGEKGVAGLEGFVGRVIEVVD